MKTGSAIRFFLNRHVVLYGALLAVLVFALKWLQWKFLIVDNAIDIYIGLIALLFTGLGIWIANQLVKPKIPELCRCPSILPFGLLNISFCRGKPLYHSFLLLLGC